MLVLLFFITDLYFLIPAKISHIFIPAEELTIPIGISTNEARKFLYLRWNKLHFRANPETRVTLLKT